MKPKKPIDVVSYGEILIDMIASAPSTSLFTAPSFRPHPGGAPVNVAVGAARLGAHAACISKVGTDDFGTGFLDALRAEQVDVRGIRQDSQSFTTLAFVGFTSETEPYYSFAMGAHARLHADEIDQTLLHDGRIFAYGSLMLAEEPARSTTLTVLERARAAGMVLAFDVNWRPTLWQEPARGVGVIRQLLTGADIVKMNDNEVIMLTGESDLMTAIAHLSTPARLVVVTRGAAGCLYRLGATIGSVAGAPAATVVDTVGAGDAFMAAMLTGMPDDLADLTEARLQTILARATQAGAISVTRRGAIPSLPYAHELPPLPDV